jgi:thiol-disulfide isomerase/thioredoxin
MKCLQSLLAVCVVAFVHATAQGGETVRLDASVVVVDAPFCYVWTIEGCPPCQQLHPVIDDLYAEGYAIGFVDANEERELYEQWGIEGCPTIQVIYRQEETGRLVGFHPLPKLRAWLKTQGLKPALVGRKAAATK